MMSGHLSDEAVAAFADGVLTGHARARATRHTAECAECAAAVREQREAVFALRAAPAPALPTDLFARLCGLPQVTPVHTAPTVVLPDGSTMLSTLPGVAPMAAFVPEPRPARPAHRVNLLATTAAVVALAGALATGAVVGGDDDTATPGATNPVNTVRTAYQLPTTAGVDRGLVPTATWLHADVTPRGGR